MYKGRAPGHIFVTTLHSNSLNPTMAVTTLLPGGLYSIGCLDILSSVAGCFSLPLSQAGHLVQQCLCISMICGIFFVMFFFFHFGMKILIYQTQAAGVVGRGLRRQKWDVSHIFSYYPTFLPPGHV